MTGSALSQRFPRLGRRVDGWVAGWNRVGTQTQFYGNTLRNIGYAVTHYRIELLRIIAQMGLGAGALVVIGGTVAIVGFLTVTTGALVAVQGYTDFSEIGVEALDGIRVGLLQCPVDRAGDHRHRPGRHHRCRRHRTTRRHADQR